MSEVANSLDEDGKSPMHNDKREYLIDQLQSLNLNTNGSDYVLIKRLNEHKRYKRSKYSWPQFYDYLLIVDFEATCDNIKLDANANDNYDYPHEIIEFPVVLYDVNQRCIKDVFHSYVRPVLCKQLSNFCIELTKISQTVIDAAPIFPDVLQRVEQWLFVQHSLQGKRYSVVCDCNSDMAQFMRLQCQISNLPVPNWCRYWINLKRTFRNFYKIPFKEKVNLQTMLKHLNYSFNGQCHSGIDDAKNITRVVEALLNDNCSLIINQELSVQSEYYTRSVSVKEAEHLLSVGQKRRSSRYKLINKLAPTDCNVIRQRGVAASAATDSEQLTTEQSDTTTDSNISCFDKQFLLIILFIFIVILAAIILISAYRSVLFSQ